jgi:2-polyprenyl-3-methyl-5-hydroxy-6-metoxy-1,4-benzoquinol methylase
VTSECVACRDGTATPFYGGLVQCDRCRHVWARLDISAEQVRRLYGRHYFAGDEYSDYLADRRIAEMNFARRLRDLLPFTNASRHRHVLEVGCAYGLFLNVARPYFDTVAGIDISVDAIEYAREQLHVDVMAGDLLTHDFGSRTHDVVCMWDTIEHLVEPDRYVEAAARQMTPGALIAITTGDISSFNARLKRERWRLIHPPTHVQYFSRRSLARMLDRQGFDIVYAKHCGCFRSLESMVDGLLRLRWGIDIRNKRSGGGSSARWPVYLNLYDILYVIGIKRPA